MIPSKKSPMTARRMAIQAVVHFEEKSPHLDKMLSRYIERFNPGSGEAKLFRNITTGVIRHKNNLTWVAGQLYNGSIKKAKPQFRAILMLAFFEIKFLDFIPPYATVNEYVELAKKMLGLQASKRVNGVLRAYMRAGKNLDPEKKFKFIESKLSARYSFPEWLIERWLKQFGEKQTRQLLASMNERPYFELRINQAQIEVEQFEHLLQNEGIEYSRSAHFHHFLKVSDIQKIMLKGWFEQGLCSVQDESAYLPVKLLDIQKGDTVLDICAAPGGKSTAILEDGNCGLLVSMDNSAERLTIVQQNISRLKLEPRCTLLLADGIKLPFANTFDRILLDAPCSGLGTIQKHPDIKWRRSLTEIENFHLLQKALLQSAADALNPNGVMVYSTCSVDRQENEDVVSAFMEKNDDQFEIVAPDSEFVKLTTPELMIRSFPHIHDMDGAFCVKIRKKE